MTEQELRLAAVQFATAGNPNTTRELLLNAQEIFNFLFIGKKSKEIEKQLEIEGNIP